MNNTSIRRFWVIAAISIGLVIYGFLPYRKIKYADISESNSLIIEQQECGCDCPDASLLKGHMIIPPEIASKLPNMPTEQLNLDIPGFNDPYNFELGHAKLFVKGNVVGVDTIECSPTDCEVVPRFLVSNWALVDNVPRMWVLPQWLDIIYFVNFLLIAPICLIIVIVRIIRQFRNRAPISDNKQAPMHV